jgi:hypothetical protein
VFDSGYPIPFYNPAMLHAACVRYGWCSNEVSLCSRVLLIYRAGI